MIARGVIPDVSAETWEEAMQAYLGALNSFHRNARHELVSPAALSTGQLSLLLPSHLTAR
jgi:hypothetical protein